MRLPRRPVPSGEQLGQAGDEGGGVLLRIKDPPRAKQETTQSSEGFLLLVAGYRLLVTCRSEPRIARNSPGHRVNEPATSSRQPVNQSTSLQPARCWAR